MKSYYQLYVISRLFYMNGSYKTGYFYADVKYSHKDLERIFMKYNDKTNRVLVYAN